MKTRKGIFGLFFMMLLLGATLVNAQPEWDRFSTVWHFENTDLGIPCLVETLTGDIEFNTFTLTLFNENTGHYLRKWQDRFKGSLTGDVSGDKYSFHEVDTGHSFEGTAASNWIYHASFILHRNGKPIAKMHINNGGTCNAATWNKIDGNWASWRKHVYFECL
jgi:hypothetical protein